jgi:cell division protein FtsI/penicillin-binding protein 2
MLNEWNKIEKQQKDKKGRRNKMLDTTIDQEINNILNDFIKSAEKKK